MRIRPLWVALAILSVPAIARADGHRAGLFGCTPWRTAASCRACTSISITPAPALRPRPKSGPPWSITACTTEMASRDSTFTGGLSGSHRLKQVVVGVQALGGRVGDGSADWAGTFGAAFEWVGSPSAARMSGVHFAPEVQTDWIARSGKAESFWRVSTGIVVRFPKGRASFAGPPEEYNRVHYHSGEP